MHKLVYKLYKTAFELVILLYILISETRLVQGKDV